MKCRVVRGQKAKTILTTHNSCKKGKKKPIFILGTPFNPINITRK